MRNPATPDCAIRGCTRAAHKGRLCTKHYALVPDIMVTECMVACISAAATTAAKYHRKQLAYVRRALREDSQATGSAESS